MQSDAFGAADFSVGQPTMLLHELWVEDGGGEQSFVLAGPMGAQARSLMHADATLTWSCWARSHFDAMTKYYKYMGWGEYATEYPDQDMKEYPHEWIETQRKAGIECPKDHGFFVASMPASRPADFYLGCHGGSVFIDFNRATNSQIRLIRISFDGYGCCSLPKDSLPMPPNDSRAFIDQMESSGIDQAVMARIVSAVLSSNQELLWQDALQEYELL